MHLPLVAECTASSKILKNATDLLECTESCRRNTRDIGMAKTRRKRGTVWSRKAKLRIHGGFSFFVRGTRFCGKGPREWVCKLSDEEWQSEEEPENSIKKMVVHPTYQAFRINVTTMISELGLVTLKIIGRGQLLGKTVSGSDSYQLRTSDFSRRFWLDMGWTLKFLFLSQKI
jgi:hypothetical protein